MIKTTYTLICDHCREEITNGSNTCIVSQGKLVGLESDVVINREVIPWHFHLTCYDEQRYQTGNTRMPKR